MDKACSYLCDKELRFLIMKFPTNRPLGFLYRLSPASISDRCIFKMRDKTKIIQMLQNSCLSLINCAYRSITGPISMGQCEALNTKHSVQTCFRIVFCCCDGNCWKYSLSLACLTHAIKICAITLKFNVWFAWNENGCDFEMRSDESAGCSISSKIFDWIICLGFRGPRSSCTAYGEERQKFILEVKIKNVNRNSLEFSMG